MKFYAGLKKGNKIGVVQVSKKQLTQLLKRYNRIRPHAKIITNFK